MIDAEEVSDILVSCGVDKAAADSVKEKYREQFGNDAAIIPQNLIDIKTLSLENEDISIKVSPSRSDLVKTTVIDGVPYVMVKVEGNVLVNGVCVHISEENS